MLNCAILNVPGPLSHYCVSSEPLDCSAPDAGMGRQVGMIYTKEQSWPGNQYSFVKATEDKATTDSKTPRRLEGKKHLQ